MRFCTVQCGCSDMCVLWWQFSSIAAASLAAGAPPPPALCARLLRVHHLRLLPRPPLQLPQALPRRAQLRLGLEPAAVPVRLVDLCPCFDFHFEFDCKAEGGIATAGGMAMGGEM